MVNSTADLTDITPVVNINNLPAQAGTKTVTVQPFLYDANHLTTAARKTQATHKMTIEMSPKVSLLGDQEIFVSLTINAAAGSVVKLIGAKSNWISRL